VAAGEKPESIIIYQWGPTPTVPCTTKLVAEAAPPSAYSESTTPIVGAARPQPTTSCSHASDRGAVEAPPRGISPSTETPHEQEFESSLLFDHYPLLPDRWDPMSAEVESSGWVGLGQAMAQPIFESVTFSLIQDSSSPYRVVVSSLAILVVSPVGPDDRAAISISTESAAPACHRAVIVSSTRQGVCL
jgi:hypothetical protein